MGYRFYVQAMCLVFTFTVSASAQASTLIPNQLTFTSQFGSEGGDAAAGEIKNIVRSDGSDDLGLDFSGKFFKATGFSFGTLSYIFQNTGTTAISFDANSITYRVDAIGMLNDVPGVDARSFDFSPDLLVAVTTNPSNGSFTVWEQELISSHRVGTFIGGRDDDTVLSLPARSQAGRLNVVDSSGDFIDITNSDSDELAALNVGNRSQILQSDETGFDVELAIGEFTVDPGQFLRISAGLNLSASAQSFAPLPTGFENAAVLDATNTASLSFVLPNTVSFVPLTGSPAPSFVSGGAPVETPSPAPIPLPASALFLIFGMLGLGSLKLKRGTAFRLRPAPDSSRLSYQAA